MAHGELQLNVEAANLKNVCDVLQLTEGDLSKETIKKLEEMGVDLIGILQQTRLGMEAIREEHKRIPLLQEPSYRVTAEEMQRSLKEWHKTEFPD